MAEPRPTMPTDRLTRRDFLAALAAGAAGTALWPGCDLRSDETPAPPPEGRPNIILIMADDLSARELGCYGHPEHRTPHLDELARTGARFRTCWATPLCLPSRGQIMTGRYGFRTGWYHNKNRPAAPLYEHHLTIGQAMQQAGYATAVAGKWQVAGTPKRYGFAKHCLWDAEP